MSTPTVWLVRTDDDVLVFANKPKHVIQGADSEGKPRKIWIDSTLTTFDENYYYMAIFCAEGFRKGTGIRVPKRPVRARVSLTGRK